ncbi:MAG: 50S ribosomal protein L19e [Candidatus Woesearchaeota archaeon]
MDLSLQKKLSAKLLKCSYKRILFNPERLQDISAAITKEDIRKLINEGAIIKVQKKGVSRSRAKKLHIQKKKGRRSGKGTRKGKKYARMGGKKRVWINRVRAQRDYIKKLKKDKLIDNKTYKRIYRLVKGGFFRSKKHIHIYLEDNNLLIKKGE